jgi:hypothetical protein
VTDTHTVRCGRCGATVTLSETQDGYKVSYGLAFSVRCEEFRQRLKASGKLEGSEAFDCTTLQSAIASTRARHAQ